MKIIRHGDCNFYQIDKLPENLKEVKSGKSFVVARGEATNSEHRVNVYLSKNLKVMKDELDNTYLVLMSDGTLTHTHDHETITIQPGIWKQVQEREVDWFADGITRKVID